MAINRAEVRLLSISEMASFVKEKLPSTTNLDGIAAKFEINHISGSTFLELTEDELREMIPCLGDRKEVKKLQDQCSGNVISRHGPVRSQCQSGWVKNMSIPDFSIKTMRALENYEITKSVRIEVVNMVAYEVWRYAQFPKSEEYNEICSAVINKYPVLKDTIGTPYGSFKQQLRQKLKNMRRPLEKSMVDVTKNAKGPEKRKRSENTPGPSNLENGDGAEDDYDEDDYDAKTEELYAELQKERPKKKTIGRLMQSTFLGRRQWIIKDRPVVAEVLAKFPCLSQSKYLFRDFAAVLGEKHPGYENAEELWGNLQCKIHRQSNLESRGSYTIRSLVETQKIELDDIFGDDLVPNSIIYAHGLELLQYLLNPRAKTKILHKCTGLDVVQDRIAIINQAEPYILLELGSGNFQFFIVAEKKIFCDSLDFIDILKYLYSIYYIFDISYPKPLYSILLFMQRLIFNIKDGQPIPPSITRLISSLDNTNV